MKGLPDGNILLYRPYSADRRVLKEIYSLQVYDGYYKPTRSCIVFDVGSYIGLFALKASKLVGKNGLIFAVEPHPKNYSLLRRNIELNNLTNVRTINVALGSRVGRTRLYIASNPAGHSTVMRPDPLCKKYIKVPMLTIDSLNKDVGSRRVFIKMDCEGAELEVLKGARRTLEKGDVTIASAAYHTPYQKNEMERYLKSKGFKIRTKSIDLSSYLYARNF